MNTRIQAIAHVHLPVGSEADFEALRRLYGDLLGLAELTEGLPPGVPAAFRSGRLELRLCADRPPAPHRMARSIVLEVDSLDGVGEALNEARLRFRSESGWGLCGRRLFVRDAAGNLVELKESSPPL